MDRRPTVALHVGLVALLLAGAAGTAGGQSPQIEWIRQFGTTTYDSVSDLASDTSHVYVAGVTNARSFSDAYLAKRDVAGNEIWTRTIATSMWESANAVASDATGVYVGGSAGQLPGQPYAGGGSDAFVRKYDADGNEVWTREFGTKTPGHEDLGRDRVVSIALTADSVYVSGDIEGPLPGQIWSGAFDGFLRKYDKSGTELWTRQFGTLYDESASSIVADATGVYVGVQSVIGLPGTDRYWLNVLKYDHAGNLLWNILFGDPFTFTFHVGVGGLTIDPSGVYLSGFAIGTIPGQTPFGGEFDCYIRKYTPGGAELWTHQYGTSADDQCGQSASDSTGVYLAGQTRGAFPGQTNSGGLDTFVRKYDPDGTELWTIQFGTAADDSAGPIAVGGAGLYVGGQTLGTFPGQVSLGDWDAFVARLQPAPVANAGPGPPVANAGPDLSLPSTEQPGAILEGTATDPDGDPLMCQWLEGATPLTLWLPVGSGGKCLLDISHLSLGQHTLTLKVKDGFFESSDSMILRVVDR